MKYTFVSALSVLILAACGSSVSDTGAGGSAATATGGSGGSGPGSCTVAGGCAATEFCDFPDGLCGKGKPGICKPASMGSTVSLPQCCCDGKTATSFCEWDGIDAASADTCPIPMDLAPCGDVYCSVTYGIEWGATYCFEGGSNTHECKPIADKCLNAADRCACILETEPCVGAVCTILADGGISVICNAG
ncbi:MAG: hypothetical protein EXR75_04050 [Myxococcales bacterium]|nr:hypothetical protein [Myxococcales bacterium]